MSDDLKTLWPKAFGVGTYRLIVTFLLALTAFDRFPADTLLVVLTIAFLNGGFSLVADVTEYRAKIENRLHDIAERKTRHTILYAQELAVAGVSVADCDHQSFWSAVDRRVETESSAGAKPTPFWWSVGLFVWTLVQRAGGDLVLLGSAAFLAGSL